MTESEKDRVAETLCLGGVNRKYYVYMLCRGNGQPFYVGKGQGRRVFDHENELQEVLAEIANDAELNDEEKEQKRSEVYEKLRIIDEEGDNLRRVIVKWGLDEREAFMCESALINALKICRDVTLGELANRVNGHASKPEKDCPSDVKTKARTTESYLQECAIKELSVDGIQACVALIKINDFYPRCLGEDGTADMEKVKDCVRGVWHVGEFMRDKVKYVFALYHGRVVGLFRVIGAPKVAGYIGQNGIEDYPIYPEDVRTAEKLALQFDSISEAQEKLPADDFAKVWEFLSNVAESKHQTEDYVFKDLKDRIYFNVDDNVPEEIAVHMNSIAIGDDSPKKFRCQAPVQYNHM